MGPQLASRGVQYFRSPITPTILGRDPRIQLLHEEDAIAALAHAAKGAPGGTFNVAGDGAMALSQSIRRAGRIEMPVPFLAFRTIGRQLMGPVMREFTAEQIDYFHFGCGLDTTRMRTELGFEPRWTTVQAFDDYIGGAALRPIIDPRWIDAAENKLLGLLGAGAEHSNERRSEGDSTSRCGFRGATTTSVAPVAGERTLSPVTSLTERLAEAEARQPKSLRS